MNELPDTLAVGPVADAVGTAGLILYVVAVIASALCLAGLATASPALAVSGGTGAPVSFVGSLAILIAHGRRVGDHGAPGACPFTVDAATRAQ